MANRTIDDTILYNIGESLRNKLNVDTTYKPSEMPAAIDSIEGYPEPTGSINITQNGTTNVKDYANAVVNVPNSYSAEDEGKVVDDGALVAQGSQTITENGTYDTTLISELIANIEGGGGGVQKDFLYEFNLSQGGAWINTNVDVSDIDTLLFEDVQSDNVIKSILVDIEDIAVYTGGTDVYTVIYRQNNKDMNARIYNNVLYVSYNGTGASSYVTKIYSYKETSGGAKNILGGITEPTSADGTDGDIYIKYTDYSNFPNEYTPLEYIQTSGTQSIDTGVLASISNLKIESKLAMTALASGNGSALWGGSWAADGFFLVCYNGKYRWHSGNKSVDTSNVSVGKWYSIIADKSQIIIDGIPYLLSSPSGVDSAYNVSLFTTTNSGSTGYKASAKMAYVRIYDGQTLIRNLIPAKRNSDDVLGMYDLVNDVFYTNSGTGTFIAGEETTGTPIDTVYLKVDGAWIILEDGDWDDVNTGE